MRYMVAAFRDRLETEGYRKYVADSLRYAPQGMCMSRGWKERPNEYGGMTAEQIAEHVIASMESQ